MARFSLYRSLLSGACAGVTTSAALAILARARGVSVWRAFNCTAHWLDGPEAAAVERCDIRHTVVGQATNIAACVFWAALLDAAFGQRRTTPLQACAAGAATALIAVPADYIATPKRFTPGWEFVFRKREIAVVYVAMAFGLAIGTRLSRRAPERA